ncbi:hypothetical protein [Actinoplanes ianthinogenes]|nr:hypothetical protein [Actinoplanes ianthinogenes]
MLANTDNGGGTDWTTQSVPQMWSMLESQDGTAHKDLLVTWKKSADLLVDHLSRVKNYRDSLAEVWPPEKSAAAAKYLDRLDDLIRHLSETYHATVQNHHALGGATSALVSARVKLAGIYEEYMSNQKVLDAYALKQQSSAQTLSKWRAVSLSPSAAVESRQLDLQVQAQVVMSTLSTDLAQAQLNITTPQPYIPGLSTREEGKGQGGRSSGINNAPGGPPSKLQQGGAAPTPSSNINLSNAGGGTNSADQHPNGSGLSSRNDKPDGHPTGPILAGSTSNTSTPVATPPTLPPQSGSFPSPANGLAIPPAVGLPPLSQQGTPPHEPSPSHSWQGPSSGTSAGKSSRQIAPGGIIGGTSNAIPARTNSGLTQRVNPTGGLIGQSPPAIIQPRRQSPNDRNGAPEIRDSWDPENPWLVDKGTDPIILPPERKAIDPGPAIGL